MGNPIGSIVGHAKGQPTDLGLNIKWHMAKRQMKHEVLARAAGIAENTLSRMCFVHGHSPSVANIQKVADALDVPLWSLFLPPEDRDEP